MIEKLIRIRIDIKVAWQNVLVILFFLSHNSLLFQCLHPYTFTLVWEGLIYHAIIKILLNPKEINCWFCFKLSKVLWNIRKLQHKIFRYLTIKKKLYFFHFSVFYNLRCRTQYVSRNSCKEKKEAIIFVMAGG